jgi:ribose 5-phosphate isomerase B
MRVAIGADHAGFELKEAVKHTLDELRVSYKDFGTQSDEAVDYPDFAAPVARGVATGRFDRGILICGTGIGMAMAANKIPGVRAAPVGDLESARLSREHNDANILTLGARITPLDRALDIVRIFVKTDFEGGRHERRVNKIAALEYPASTLRAPATAPKA